MPTLLVLTGKTIRITKARVKIDIKGHIEKAHQDDKL